MSCQFPAKELGDSVGFLIDLSFGEVYDPVPGCFKSEVGGLFVEVSEGTTGAVDLNGKPLLLPKEVDHHSGDAFSRHTRPKVWGDRISPPLEPWPRFDTPGCVQTRKRCEAAIGASRASGL